MTPLDAVLAKFDDAQDRGGSYMARCPAHDDDKPSLSIAEGKEGRVLLKCHAGCEVHQILAALNLPIEALFPPNANQRRIEATYDYVDEKGALLFQTVRKEGKKFSQRQPDPAKADAWLWNLRGVRRIPYRLPQILAASDQGAVVFVVEGEKDVHSLEKRGLIATTNAMGAEKWPKHFGDFLVGAHVVILPDNDGPGQKHGEMVARSCQGKAASVKVVNLPGLPPKGDVSDWLAAGGTREALEALVESAPPWNPNSGCPSSGDGINRDSGEGGDDSPPEAEEKRERVGAAAWLMTRAQAIFELWHSADETAYATALESPRRTLPVKSSAFRRELTRSYFDAFDKPAPAAALQSAIDTADAVAAGGAVFEIHTRKADCGDALYIDLGGPDWRAVKVTAAGWEIVSDAPVRFRRPATMKALPEPERGGTLDELRKLVNVTDEQWPLFVGWLLGALGPHNPYALLCVSGEQGSAKTTLSRFAKRLTDPATLELRRVPYELEDLSVATHSGFVLAFDNISNLSADLSDALCMISTGGGFSRRRRHTDLEETVTYTKAPVILNGIATPDRPDLLDRCLMLSLPVIPEEERQAEAEVESAFAEAHGRIFGALLDILAVGLRNLPTVKLDRMPRMADFARWVQACEPACGWESEAFLKCYDSNREEATEIGMEASPVAALLLRLVEERQRNADGDIVKEPGVWIGTADELRQQMFSRADDKTRSLLPANARALSVALQRLLPILRANGYHAEQGKTNGRKVWRVTKVEGQGRKSSDAQGRKPDEPSPTGSQMDDRVANPLCWTIFEKEEEIEGDEVSPISPGSACAHIENLRPAEGLRPCQDADDEEDLY